MKNVTKRLLVLLVITTTFGTVQNGWSQSIVADVDLSGIIFESNSYIPDNPNAPMGILFDNGPVFNSTGTGAGGANESIYYQGGSGSYGSGCQFASGIYVADDFTVPTGKSWALTSIDFYSYQTNSGTASTITGIYVRIWNGKPGVAGSIVVWGDMATNRMGITDFSNVYRVLTVNGGTARPIMRVEASTTGLLLNAGSYWIEYACTGSLTSGPWMPPVVTAENVTGNAIQTVDAGFTYADILYNTYAQGCPFVIHGTEISATMYFNYNTNGSNNSFPFNLPSGKDVQILYLPGDFNQPIPAPAGNITSFSFRIADTYPLGPWTYTDLTIKMGQSTITSFTAGTFYSPLSTVYYRASVSLTGVPGQWMTIPLDTPFPYDPVQSLIVDLGHCGAPGATGFSLCFTNNSTAGFRRLWSVGGCPFIYSGVNYSVYHTGLTFCPQPTITGNANICNNGVSYDYTTEAGMTGYAWTVSPGNLITGGQGTNQVQVSWTVPGAQWISVIYTSTSGCTASAPTVFNVTANPPPVPTISGPTSVCVTSTGNVYTTQAGMTSYSWNVSPGGTITAGGTPTSDYATVTWNSAGAQTVGVNYADANGCTAVVPTDFNVTVTPQPVPTINGPASVCVSSTGNVYATQFGMTGYIWTVSPGNDITGGQGTNQAQVTWNAVGAQWVAVSYTATDGCPSVLTVFNITVNPLPVPILIGPTSVCAYSTGNVYNTQAGMNNYYWFVSPGGTITAGGTSTSDYATVTWNTAGAQLVYTNYANANGCYAAVNTILNVAVNPAPVTPVITQSGNTLNSDAILGNQWYLNGAIISGATNQCYTAVYNGNYYDIVTLNGCSSQMSNVIAVVVTQINNTELVKEVSIYPNPSHGQFILSFTPEALDLVDIRILNNLGISVYEQKGLQVDGTLKLRIDLSLLPRGVYSVVLNTEGRQIIRKIVIY